MLEGIVTRSILISCLVVMCAVKISFYMFIQASWEKRIVGRVYNVYKGEKRKLEDGAAVSEKKRAKITDRYPPLALSDVSDEATNSRNREALNKELSKKNPIKSTILELMELTYGCRREYIVNEARSVHEILEKYPALSRPDVVSVT